MSNPMIAAQRSGPTAGCRPAEPALGSSHLADRLNSFHGGAMRLPDTGDSLVIRTDYSDDAAWDAVRAAMRAPTEVDGFRANVAFVSDPTFDGLDAAQVVGRWPPDRRDSFFFVVDATALRDPEHPVLVVDLNERRGRTFRVIPSSAWSVENNLSLANLDFRDFAESVDRDGVFRGFRE